MTVMEMLSTVKRHAKLVAIITLVSTAACAALLFLYLGRTPKATADNEKAATARVITNGFSGSVGAFAVESQRLLAEEDGDYRMELDVDKAPHTVTITILGPDGETAATMANELAHESLAQAEELNVGTENPFHGVVVEAEAPDDADEYVPVVPMPKLSTLKLVAVLIAACLGSLILAAFIAICVDSRRHPIRSMDSIVTAFHASGYDDPDMTRMQEALSKSTVLAELPTPDAGAQVLANTRFAVGRDDLDRICVVPLGDAGTSREVADALARAIAQEGSAACVESCASVIDNIALVYDLRASDAVILAIKLWSDTIDQLKYTLKELTLADVAIAGFVLVS